MDIIFYLTYGIIGCNELQASFAKDLDWEDARSTYLATYNNIFSQLNLFCLNCFGMYKYYTNDTGYFVGIDLERYLILRQYYLETVNDCYKNLFIKSYIFWNTLRKDPYKQNEVLSIWWRDRIFINDPPEDDETQGDIYYFDLDLTDKQELTKEIYDDYVSAVAEFLYRIKTFIKMATNSNLEEFQMGI